MSFPPRLATSYTPAASPPNSPPPSGLRPHARRLGDVSDVMEAGAAHPVHVQPLAGREAPRDAGGVGRPLARRVREPSRGLVEPVDAGDPEEAVRRGEPVLVLLVPGIPVGGE